MMLCKQTLASWLAVAVVASTAPLLTQAQGGPKDVETTCGLKVKLEQVGSMPLGGSNIASPVPYRNNNLLLIDTEKGKIYVDKQADGIPTEIFDAFDDTPAGLDFNFQDLLTEYVANVAAGPSNNELYVALQSKTIPDGISSNSIYYMPEPIVEGHSWIPFTGPLAVSEQQDLYRLGDLPTSAINPNTGLEASCGFTTFCCICNPFFPATTYSVFHVIYKFKFTGNKLSDPVPLAAFETQTGPTHKGGGMTALPDGRVLYATGDALPFGTNGREGAQDNESSVSKLFVIDSNGNVELLAKGLRQPQRLEILETSPPMLAIGEIGGVTAEEVNVYSLDELLDTSIVENFGWGIGPDGLGREGTFYTAPGTAGIFGTQPPAVGTAPTPEPGYIQPHAQYGRFDASQFIAVTGPVGSTTSFITGSIKLLFADLPSGTFLATTGAPGTYDVDEPICSVTIVDANGVEYANAVDFAGTGSRVDPRFFKYPDNTAGVIFESTGVYYRVTEV